VNEFEGSLCTKKRKVMQKSWQGEVGIQEGEGRLL
jgi:hypothetical protein